MAQGLRKGMAVGGTPDMLGAPGSPGGEYAAPTT